MYLGRESPRDHANQDQMGQVDPTPVTSSWPKTNNNHSLPAHHQESSHTQPSQTCNSGGTLSSMETCMSPQLSTDHNIGNIGSFHAADHELQQSSMSEHANGNGGSPALQAKRRPHHVVSVATRMKQQKSALGRAVSDTTRANQSLNSARAKLYLVKRIRKTKFEYEGKLVDFAIIRTQSAVAKFLECTPESLWRALHRKNANRGVVNDMWQVEDQGKARISA